MESTEQPSASGSTKQSYKTTRPIVPLTTERSSIDVPINDSLTVQLRPFDASDIDFVHRLRTQEIVMVQTSKGSIDADVAESQVWMDRFLPPNDGQTYNLMIWVKYAQSPWEHIGVIGSHIMLPVPHIGYMIRSEWWGKSIATRTLQVFLEHWWTLPRKVVEVSIDEYKDEDDQHFISLERANLDVSSHSDDIVPEVMLAEIEHKNIGSIRVVTKCGFQYRGERKILERGQEFTLLEYTVSRPQFRNY